MLYKLKKIGWYLSKDNSLYIYEGNNFMRQEIVSDNPQKIYEFIKAFDKPMYKETLRKKLSQLNDNEFDSIFNFFLDRKWVYGIEKPFPEEQTRMVNLIDSFPGFIFPQYIKKISNVKILLLGLGTAGSYVLEALTKLGFIDFILIDGDIVERKNLIAQNYSFEDIGKFKTDVIKKKYSRTGINISTFNKEIKSYSDLEKNVNLKEINYFINCADDFPLLMDMLGNILLDYPNIKIISSGYSFLVHWSAFIDKVNYKEFIDLAKRQVEGKIINNLIVE